MREIIFHVRPHHPTYWLLLPTFLPQSFLRAQYSFSFSACILCRCIVQLILTWICTYFLLISDVRALVLNSKDSFSLVHALTLTYEIKSQC